ncbi:hypothetical protein FHS72_003641 [Loktanella ponticola]|uniref:Uncharacterized protein n=1 Tax=Yoonia ponticola TaxID=1524255 RepID=A0A7W9BNZ5_9RHOB|nr:hypothetical protein [Yoonia ponticola]MBB5723993.1 hypothetical protein [Yoonia ponticola]
MSKPDPDSPDFPTELIRLGEYVWPQGETRQTLVHTFENLTAKIPWLAKQEYIQDEDLHSIHEQGLIAACHERLQGILFNCLDNQFLDWATTPDEKIEQRVFVSPPMRQDLLRDWAKLRGLAIVTSLDDVPDDETADAVVFNLSGQHLLRQYDSIDNVRALIRSFSKRKRKVIFGCNSWAWRYMNAITAIDMSLPNQVTTPAFTDKALAALLEPTISQTYNLTDIRSEASGEPVFERDEDGELKDPYFTKLAKRSLGVPWGAIEMFFDDARAATEDEDTPKDHTATMWLRQSGSPSVPSHDHALICLALQNLLIHEPCRSETIENMLPRPLPQGIWTTLASLGFISIDDDGLRHNPRHYAAMRSALGTAGLNLDQL